MNRRDPKGKAVYVVYREFNQRLLRKGYPFVGHYYLAFDRTGLSDPQSWDRLVRRLSTDIKPTPINIDPNAETFSLHPLSVRNNDDQGNLASTIATLHSFIGYDDPFDQEQFRTGRSTRISSKGKVAIRRIEATQEEQERLYVQAVAARRNVNAGIDAFGRYLLGLNNCGTWAKDQVQSCGLSWPNAADSGNAGAGLTTMQKWNPGLWLVTGEAAMYGAEAKVGLAEWRLLGAGASAAVRGCERGVTAGVNALQRAWTSMEDAFASADDQARRTLGGSVIAAGPQ